MVLVFSTNNFDFSKINIKLHSNDIFYQLWFIMEIELSYSMDGLISNVENHYLIKLLTILEVEEHDIAIKPVFNDEWKCK